MLIEGTGTVMAMGLEGTLITHCDGQASRRSYSHSQVALVEVCVC